MAIRKGDKNQELRLPSLKMLASSAIFASLAVSSPAIAAPFTCSGEIYQVQSGQLRVFDPISSSYVNIGAQNGSYNATGFNTQDNFGYGMQGNNVIRVNSDGTLDTLYNVGFGSYAGDVDDSNNLWLRRTASRYSRVNLATGAVTTFDFTGQVNNAADVVFVREGGVPYLLAFAGGRVGRLNLNTLTSTRVTVAGLPGGTFGAQWTDFNGRIFAFRNTDGQIFEIFDAFTSTPTATLAAQGDPSGDNDGFSCPEAPFPNLPPVAQDDDFTTPFETPLTRSLFINNGNGADFDPEGQPLTMNTAPVSQPSNGSVTLAANGSMTYTPNPGFYGTDTFEYEIADVTGLTATATVTIVVPAPPIDIVTRKTLLSPTSNPTAGDTVTFLIEVENTGPADATGVTLTDVIPSGLTPTANNGNVTAGTYNAGSGLWTIGTLANGDTETLTIEGTVDPAPGGTNITNVTTKAEGDQTDPSDAGNDPSESIVVFPLTLNANDDNSLDIMSASGSTNALNVFDDDTLQGNPVDNSITFVNLAPGETLPTGLTFDTASGIVGVTPGTLPGTYSFDYQICETVNPTNCDIATATVTVIPTPIDANNDEVFGIVGASGAPSVLNAFDLDTLDTAAATASNTTVALAPSETLPAGITFNTANGDVGVSPGTPAGSYTFDYQLCELSNPANCDIANIFIEVIAAEITASNDFRPPLTGVTGNPNIGNAFDNDTLNGASANAADLTTTITAPATPVSGGAPVPQLDPLTGIISVPPGTPGGSYTIGYRICETINPMNCATALVAVTIITTADLSITKTNTPGANGEVDQPGDTVTSGDIVTYTLEVTNNGPDSVEGARVTDNPTAGLTCPATNAVTISGDGVPTGNYTVSDLTGSGISLALLELGEKATFTFDCTVD